MAVKPISQQFSDDLTQLVEGYRGTELTNAECVGALSMYLFMLQSKINKKTESDGRPY